MHSHIDCTYLTFASVCFQMSHQIACLKGCIVTLIAFVWLFSTVCFQVCPQIVFPRGFIVTLVAFFWLFSFVCFYMSFTIVCLRKCIVALVALLTFFFHCVFLNGSLMIPDRMQSHTDCTHFTFCHCFFLQVSPQITLVRKWNGKGCTLNLITSDVFGVLVSFIEFKVQ